MCCSFRSCHAGLRGEHRPAPVSWVQPESVLEDVGRPIHSTPLRLHWCHTKPRTPQITCHRTFPQCVRLLSTTQRYTYMLIMMCSSVALPTSHIKPTVCVCVSLQTLSPRPPPRRFGMEKQQQHSRVRHGRRWWCSPSTLNSLMSRWTWAMSWATIRTRDLQKIFD